MQRCAEQGPWESGQLVRAPGLAAVQLLVLVLVRVQVLV